MRHLKLRTICRGGVHKEIGLNGADVYKRQVCDGIDKCRTALLRASKGLLPNNFIEGMACVGGCIGGSGNLVRYEDAPEEMEDHIEDAVSMEMLPNVKKNINIF